MRQIVLEEPRQLVGHILPALIGRSNEALVRIQPIAICGSGWHAYDGNQPNYRCPRIIGHELSGEVLQILKTN